MLTGGGTSPSRGPLSGAGIELNAAKPGSIINTASLEGLSHVVYTLTVQVCMCFDRSGLHVLCNFAVEEVSFHRLSTGCESLFGLVQRKHPSLAHGRLCEFALGITPRRIPCVRVLVESVLLCDFSVCMIFCSFLRVSYTLWPYLFGVRAGCD